MVALGYVRQQGITIETPGLSHLRSPPISCLRRFIAFLGAIIMAAAADQAIKELAPTGKLRVGVAVGPAASGLWCVGDAATGKGRGVPVEVGTALERWRVV